jgi:hypothetical protein
MSYTHSSKANAFLGLLHIKLKESNFLLYTDDNTV